ncbi:MAG: 4-(cytidine 5'-diphospho)-2-C-methyl-D-erythritol kinase [Gemmatimonadaceae bacterium]
MSVPAARLAAQAKVNLSLRVGPRRADGYHEIATIFARIELADDVVVRILRTGVTLSVMRDGRADASLEDPSTNLATRAARVYMEAAGWPTGCGVHIEKRIPVGAGLGGGSADAGAVLRALDSMSPRPLGTTALANLAAHLGSDVPFLTHDDPMALGLGRGDIVEPIPSLETRWLALVMPPLSISTAEAYGWLDADRKVHGEGSWADVGRLGAHARDWDTIAQRAANDLETPVYGRHPQLAAYRRTLREGGAFLAMMSGSGSAVFGVFDEAPDVVSIARACEAPVTASRVPARVVAPPGGE